MRKRGSKKPLGEMMGGVGDGGVVQRGEIPYPPPPPLSSTSPPFPPASIYPPSPLTRPTRPVRDFSLRFLCFLNIPPPGPASNGGGRVSHEGRRRKKGGRGGKRGGGRGRGGRGGEGREEPRRGVLHILVMMKEPGGGRGGDRILYTGVWVFRIVHYLINLKLNGRKGFSIFFFSRLY